MKTTPKLDPKTLYAAQNARLGLIKVADLSLLTGVEVSQLNKFAKNGNLNHYGEYHGTRFYNFEEIVNWLSEPTDQNEAKPVIRAKLEATIQGKNCPYTLEKTGKASEENQRVRIIWKEFAEK